MEPDTGDPGRMLYEERLALLPGLWMPQAPGWEDLSDEDRDRWRSYAAENAAAENSHDEDSSGEE